MIEAKNIVLVFIGSATGGTLRYLLSIYFISKEWNKLPWATLSINLIGCFMIGAIYAIVEKSPNNAGNLKLLLATGFCGGFTTFSAFAIENLHLIKQGATSSAIVYIATSLIIGILLAFLGFSMFK